MRKFLIGIAVLLIVLIGALVIAFMNVNGILAENRERLTAMASDAVGRTVDYQEATVAFSRGLAVRVEGLRVAEDPAFGKDAFVALDSAFVGVRIWPALFGEIEVSGVRLERPVIRILSTAKGFNFETLGGSGTEAAGDGTPAAEESAPGEGEGGPMALAIAAFEIDDGTLIYEDRTSDPPLRLTIDRLDTSGSDLALTGPVALSFSGRIRPTGAATDGSAPMSTFAGEVDLDDVAIPSGTLRLESPRLYPAIAGVELGEDPLADHLDELAVEVGIPPDPEKTGYALELRSAAGSLAGFDYQKADIAAVYLGKERTSEVEIQRALVGIADGNVALTGKLTLADEGQPAPFTLDLDLRNLDSGQLATALLGLSPGLVSGRVGGDVTLSGKSLEWERLKRTLAGSLALRMDDGALEQVNLLDTLVGRLVSDPGLGTLMASSLRAAAPEALSGNRTEIQDLALGFDVAGGTFTSKELKLDASHFAVTGAGKVGIDGSVSGSGTFLLSEAISKKLVQKTDALSALQAEGGRVAIPIGIGGTTSAMSLRPDLSALAAGAKRELQNKAASELGDLLFGKKKKETDGEAAKEEGAPPSDRDVVEDTVRKGLGRLFGN
jgi:AsmA protein